MFVLQLHTEMFCHEVCNCVKGLKLKWPFPIPFFFFFACWRVVEVARGDAGEEMEEAEQVAYHLSTSSKHCNEQFRIVLSE